MKPIEKTVYQHLKNRFLAIGYELVSEKEAYQKITFQKSNGDFTNYFFIEFSEQYLNEVIGFWFYTGVRDLDQYYSKSMHFVNPLHIQIINFEKNPNILTKIPNLASVSAHVIANAANYDPEVVKSIPFGEKYPDENPDKVAQAIFDFFVAQSSMPTCIYNRFDTIFQLYEEMTDCLENPHFENAPFNNYMYWNFAGEIVVSDNSFLYYLLLLKKMKIPMNEKALKHYPKMTEVYRIAYENFNP